MSVPLPQVGHLERLAPSGLLVDAAQVEQVFTFGLENIQPAVQADLPTDVGLDRAGVERIPSDLVVEVDRRPAEAVFEVFQVLFLLLLIFRVRTREQGHLDLLFLWELTEKHITKLQDVLHVVENPNVGVNDLDPAGSTKIVCEELLAGDARLVLLNHQMPTILQVGNRLPLLFCLLGQSIGLGLRLAGPSGFAVFILFGNED